MLVFLAGASRENEGHTASGRFPWEFKREEVRDLYGAAGRRHGLAYILMAGEQADKHT